MWEIVRGKTELKACVYTGDLRRSAPHCGLDHTRMEDSSNAIKGIKGMEGQKTKQDAITRERTQGRERFSELSREWRATETDDKTENPTRITWQPHWWELMMNQFGSFDGSSSNRGVNRNYYWRGLKGPLAIKPLLVITNQCIVKTQTANLLELLHECSLPASLCLALKKVLQHNAMLKMVRENICLEWWKNEPLFSILITLVL